MDRVNAAVKAGKCVVAIGGHLLRDPQVLLAVRDRPALPFVVLSGNASHPLKAPSAESLARATEQADGVLVLIEPDTADRNGLNSVAKIIAAASHKPTVMVVSRSPNPLLYSMLFRGAAVGHLKSKGGAFTKRLAVPEMTEAPKVQSKKAKSKGSDAPRKIFVGRDDDVQQVQHLLSEGGPIVISGAEGVGRSTLVDHAVATSGLTRLPDVILGRGAGFDTLMARIGMITADGGSDALTTLFKQPHTPLQAIQTAIEALKAAEGASDKVLVVHPLEVASGKEGGFFRKDRLGALVSQLLSHRYPLRIVFLSIGQPQLYSHEANQAVRRFEVGPILGRFFHEIFAAFKAPEFGRDAFGPMSDKIHGHPMMARQYAIEVRNRENGLTLVDSSKFLKMDGPTDTDPLRKLFRKGIDKMDEGLRSKLATLAHARRPLNGSDLPELGIGRKDRIRLLADGYLETVGTDDNKMYRVHPLVRSCMRMREISDFDVLDKFRNLYSKRAADSSGMEQHAWRQEANRVAVAGRNARSRIKMSLPDQDPAVESCIGMIRSKQPHFGMAKERLTEILAANPGNADAHLLKLELMRRVDAKMEYMEEAYETAMTLAPIPEVFHDACTFYMVRRARPKAINVLERAVQLMPEEVRLKTRLGALLMRDGRRNEATELLKAAMAQAPMLPDAYGLLGMAKRDEGVDALEESEQLLREAVRLAPNDPVQIPRLVLLLLALARVNPGRADALRDEAKELLDRITRADQRNADGFLLLAELQRELGNLDRAEWLIKQARKQTDKRHDRNNRIRLQLAMLDVQRGDLDNAEKTVRDLIHRDAGNWRLFESLAQVLTARDQLIPAFTELQRARERVNARSLDGMRIQQQLDELQKNIEAQAAAMGAQLAAAPAVDAAPEADAAVQAAPEADAAVQAAPEADAAVDAAPETDAAVDAAPEADAAVDAAPEADAAPEVPAAIEADAAVEATAAVDAEAPVVAAPAADEKTEE